MYHQITEADLNYFETITKKSNIYYGQVIHDQYAHDEMELYGKYMPDCVIQVETADEISKLVAYCNEKNIAITPRGAGTGLCGGCVAIHGGLVISFEKMNKILEIDKKTMTAVVEPGVLLMEIGEAVEKEGLLYAPDPGEKSASIGGNVVTNAGGMRAVKYGVTKDYVKGLEVVLPNGELVKFGGKTVKNSSGYNLKDLIVGSEGTLGIVSKIYLKLLPKPKKMISLLIPFNDLKECLDLVSPILNLANVPTTVEFMEQEVILDSQQFLNKTFPSNEYPAYLIVSYSGNTQAELDLMIKECAELCLKQGAIDIFISDTQERQESIWSARGAFLEAIKSSTTIMDECDVALDIDKIYEFMNFVKALSDKEKVRIRSFGHAGDGNLHIYVCKDDLSDERWEVVNKLCMDEMYAKAKSLDGQVSGEHGIGHAKKSYLVDSLGESQIHLMRGIKHTFDPNNIMNPGKII